MSEPQPMEHLQDYFVKGVRENANRIAVCYDDGVNVTSLSYEETHSLACQVTDFLKSFNVQNAVVGYFGDINALVPSILVGILESSASFAIIEKNAPTAYSFNLVQKLGIKYVIVEQSFYQMYIDSLESVKIQKEDVFYVGAYELYLLTILDVDCMYHILPGDRQLAYSIQTSGTTGHPKLVKVPHNCIVPNIADFCQLFTVSVEDTILLTAPLTFDPSIVEMFTALSTGATLLIIPDVLKAIPQKFIEMVFERHKATIIQATPSLFRRIDAETLKKTLLSASSQLRVLAFGGESCPTIATIRSWKENGNQTIFYNIYGITEVSSWATIHRIDVTSGSDLHGSIPLGQPLSLTVLEVRDGNGKVVMQGEGQLHIGGSQRICLIDDEDPNCLNQKVTRPTGDSVLCKPDGSMIFLGRQDDMFKRNGKKCSLSSVERAAAAVLHGSSCCCVYEESVEKLWLFVVLAPDIESRTMKNIHHRLTSLLPRHCIPDEVFSVPVLPVTSHGKVDRAALVCLAKSQNLLLPSKADIGAIRRAFLNSWKKLSSEVNDDDNFILQGGDSFSAVRFSESMALLTGHPLPLLTEKLLQETLVSVWEYIVNCISGSKICHQMCSNQTIIIGNTPAELGNKERYGGLNKRLGADVDENSRGSVRKKLRDTGHYIKSKTEVVVVQRAKPMECGECSASTRYWLSTCGVKENCTLHLKWKYDLNKCVDASPTVIVQYRNKITSVAYVGSHSHRMAAVDFESGRELWVTHLKGRIESSAAAASCGQFIIVGCYDHSVYCLNTRDGTVRWQFSTNGEVKSSPCIASGLGLVYVGSHDRHLYAIEVERGTCKWMLQPGNGSVFASPFYCKASGNLYAATLDGIFCTVNPMTGIVRWKISCGHPIFSSPAASSVGVCFGCVDSFIYCYDLTGQKKWQFATSKPVFSSPCIFKCDNHNEELILCGSHDHFVYCLNFDSGTLLWKIEMDAPIYASSFAFQILASDRREKDSRITLSSYSQLVQEQSSTGETFVPKSAAICCGVALVSTTGLLKVVNVKVGRTMATFQFAGEVFSSPVVVGQALIVGCRDNFLYCVSLQTG